MPDAVDDMFRQMTEETKEKICAALGRTPSEAEMNFILAAWTTIRMHRDLAVGVSDAVVDLRCMKCASAIYHQAVWDLVQHETVSEH